MLSDTIESLSSKYHNAKHRNHHHPKKKTININLFHRGKCRGAHGRASRSENDNMKSDKLLDTLRVWVHSFFFFGQVWVHS